MGKKIKSEETEEPVAESKFSKTEHDLEKLSKDTAASDMSEEKKERIQTNVDHMKQNLERMEKSTDKSEKERLQKAMKLRLQAIKKIKAEEPVAESKFAKTEHDLEKLVKDTMESDLPEAKKERIETNAESMKKDLERIEQSTDKAERQRLQKAMKLRLQSIKKLRSSSL